MRRLLVGEAQCRASKARYYLLEEDAENPGAYGVQIELDGEGNPVSRKDDRFQHGIGLVSVRQIVERGGGFLQIEIDPQSHIFAARLHFCVS